MNKLRNLLFGVSLYSQFLLKDQDVILRKPEIISREVDTVYITEVYEDQSRKALNEQYNFLKAYLQFLQEELSSESRTSNELEDVLENGRELFQDCYQPEFELISLVILKFRIRILEKYVALYENLLKDLIDISRTEEQDAKKNEIELIISSIATADLPRLRSIYNTSYFSCYLLQSLSLTSTQEVSEPSSESCDHEDQISDPLFLPKKVKKQVTSFIASSPQVNIHLATRILTSIPGITITQAGKGDHGSICRNGKAINTFDKGGFIGGSAIPFWLFMNYQTKGHMGNPAPFTKEEIHFGIAKAKGYLK